MMPIMDKCFPCRSPLEDRGTGTNARRGKYVGGTENTERKASDIRRGKGKKSSTITNRRGGREILREKRPRSKEKKKTATKEDKRNSNTKKSSINQIGLTPRSPKKEKRKTEMRE